MTPPARRIPYAIVGGFLGAGKTSLITGVLQTATERVAVIVNDLGALGLDAEILRRATRSEGGSKSIELGGGCVCCTAGTNLALTLRDLSLRDPPPDRILLECSGVADPGRVARYGSRRVLVEPVTVVVVDSTDIGRRLADRNWAGLVEAQLDAADVLVVSKTDLTGPQVPASREVPSWLSDRRPDIPVVVGRPEEIGRTIVGGDWGPMSPRGGDVPSETLASGEVEAEAVSGRGGDGGRGRHGPGRRGPRFEVRSHRFASAVSDSELERFLDGVEGLVRAKGVVMGDEGPVLVQWAAGRCGSRPWPEAADAVLGLTLVISPTGSRGGTC